MATVTRTITVHICERCEHEWVPREDVQPRVCPKCKSPYWDRKPTRSNAGKRRKRKTAKKTASKG